eukprot:scaffold119091_cov66-Phaeocystis_antarctica.AAC.1
MRLSPPLPPPPWRLSPSLPPPWPERIETDAGSNGISTSAYFWKSEQKCGRLNSRSSRLACTYDCTG